MLLMVLQGNNDIPEAYMEWLNSNREEINHFGVYLTYHKGVRDMVCNKYIVNWDKVSKGKR